MVPPLNDPIALDLHEVKEAKVQRIILDGVKDHLIPHLSDKDTVKKMWDVLTKLYRSRTTLLKDKLHGTRMSKGESMTSYFSRLAQCRDELAAVGETTAKEELVLIALNVFLRHWEIIFKCVMGRDHLSNWARLWCWDILTHRK